MTQRNTGSLLNVEDYDWEQLEKFVENTDTESQISFDTYGLVRQQSS